MNQNSLNYIFKRGYLETRFGRAEINEKKYYDWCKSSKYPLIKAHSGAKFSSVSIDMITTNFDLSEAGQKRIFWLFKKYTDRPSSIVCSHGYCSVQRVHNGDVNQVILDLKSAYSDCRIVRDFK